MATLLAITFLAQPCAGLMAATSTASSEQTSKNKKSAGTAASKSKSSAPAKPAQKKQQGKNSQKPAASKQKTQSQPATPSSKELKKQQQSAQAEINKTREDIRKNEEEVKKGLNELSRLEDGIAISKKETQTLSNEVGKLSGKISDLESKIAADERELGRLRTEYLKAVKKMRVSRKRNSGFAYLFSAKNMAEAERRMRYLKEFSEWKTWQTEAINARVEALKANRKDLERAKSDKNVMLNREMTAQKKLNEQKARQDVIIADLKANGDVLQAHLAKKQAEVNQLKNQVAAVIAEEQRRLEEQRRAEAERKRKQEEAARAERERKEKERLERERAEKERKEREAAEAARKRQAQEEIESRREREEAKKKESSAQKETPKKTEPKKTEPKKETPKKTEPKKTEPKKETSPKKESNKSYAEARQRKPRNEAPKKEEPKKTTSKKEEPRQDSPKQEPKQNSGGDFAGMRGALPRPVSGAWRITGKFGKHSLPDLPNVTYDNPGIDVEVSKGAAVNAVYQGSVSGVYMVPGFGTVIIVNHGDYYTVYGNIASASVKVGDKVKQGQRLGSAGENPDDPGHGSLHFEVWKGREKQNPTGWIK
ncbi:MAG: peptidoglycan DD-metalloendopeptidase family protein [Muribaculaceae bacterium]|nr:peptidoglycan DD-metalloendopeptidase family protein [Muribaculaceae bacterium]